ncbi:MAG: ATP phosphoribosyltransferase [Actinomycetota bacterium]|nr:ATP phosphoribosyltransferase [Actinomycetota bacterium]
MKQSLKIAIPKGYLLDSTIKLLDKAGYDMSCFSAANRKLFLHSKTDNIKYILTRPMDVPVYVESGACDLGFAGKDVLLEKESNVFELLDLKDGFCRIIIATKSDCVEKVKSHYEHFGSIKVATKYPNITRKYFKDKGMQVEIIKLYGSVELAPILGIADEILDITATGKTMTENNLVEMENVAESTTRLIANEVSYRVKNDIIENFINSLKIIMS